MKNILAALAFSLLLCAAGTGHTLETPVQDEAARAQLEKLGTFFMPIAAQFGCTAFASGNVLNEGRLASLEYLPPGVESKAWTRRVTITVHALGEDSETGKQAMSKHVETLSKEIEEHSRLLGKAFYKNKSGEDGVYLEYTTGSGAGEEHKAGVFMRVSPVLAAFMQVQSRGAALSAEDRLKMKQLLDPRAKQ